MSHACHIVVHEFDFRLENNFHGSSFKIAYLRGNFFHMFNISVNSSK